MMVLSLKEWVLVIQPLSLVKLYLILVWLVTLTLDTLHSSLDACRAGLESCEDAAVDDSLQIDLLALGRIALQHTLDSTVTFWQDERDAGKCWLVPRLIPCPSRTVVAVVAFVGGAFTYAAVSQ